MSKCKELLKSLNSINNDMNLTQGEALALYRLIEYYNDNYGYAFPNYEHLMTAIKTKRKATVSNVLKGLVAKGYITIEKMGYNKNKYLVHKHLYFKDEEPKAFEQPTSVFSETKVNAFENMVKAKPVAKNTDVAATQKPVDSNGRKPLKNQIHVDEVLDPKVIEIAEYTGFNKNQSKELLSLSDGDKGKVINAFEYMQTQRQKKKVNDPFHYTKWAIEHNKIIVTQVNNPYMDHKEKELKFCNFEARQYDYDMLERKLLGWDDGEMSNDPADYRTDNKKLDFEGVC